MKIFKVLFTTFHFVILAACVCAQDWKTLDADAIYQLARQEVFNGNVPDGQHKLRFIVEKNPGYDDVKIFLARSYAWEKSYDDARAILSGMLKANPWQEEAMDALIDVERWSGNYDQALAAAEVALAAYPDNAQFMFKKASILHSLSRDEKATETLALLLNRYPEHAEATALRKSIAELRMKYSAGISYNADVFSRTFAPGQLFSAQIGRSNSWGTSLVRVNYASRFHTNGWQVEADLYPKISEGKYAYLSYGYSVSELFPSHRIGAEVFSNLPKKMEGSAGVRYMDFGGNTRVIVFTGSAGIYAGNYWISLRPYVTPDPSGTSTSGALSVRRYFADADNYIGATIGLGFSPDLKTLQTSAGLTESRLTVLNSRRAGIVWQKGINTWIVNLAVDITRQELSFDESEYVTIAGFSTSVRKKF